jgi:hypothetical protein
MKRALRARFAALAACVIAFAQIALAAQPWPLDVVQHRSAPAAAPDAPASAPEHCIGHLAQRDAPPAQLPAPPSQNLCEVHCQDAAQPDALLVAVAAPTPQAWFPLTPADPVAERSQRSDLLAAKSASPPARVLFSRFLN